MSLSEDAHDVKTPSYERFTPPEEAHEVLESVTYSTRSARVASRRTSRRFFYTGDRTHWITGTTLPIDDASLQVATPTGPVAEAVAA
jgi:hypothetical protein